jgi:hypothetical protein
VLTKFDQHRSDFLIPAKKDTAMRSLRKHIPVQAYRPHRSTLFGAAMLLMSAVITGRANGASDEHPQTDQLQTQTSEPLSGADLDKLGMQKLAEMTAMSRHDEICPDVPDEWSAALRRVTATAIHRSQSLSECTLTQRLGK